jgi:hypothetical protein
VKTWERASKAEQAAIQTAGKEFLSAYTDHVRAITKESHFTVPPTGSDLFRPELWKGMHWRWFLETCSLTIPQPKKVTLWEKIKAQIYKRAT